MTPNVTLLIQNNESCRLRVYDDATGRPIGPGSVVQGHPTIGWGIALDTAGLTQAEADLILANRVASATAAAAADVGADVWAKLDAIRQAVLTDMAYTMGQAGLAQWPHFLAAIRAGDWTTAAATINTSLWGTRQAPGRARRDATMLITGEWPADLTQED